MAQVLPPFSCSYSPGFSQLLFDLNCTLAISTYQAGKLVFISSIDPDKVVQLPRSFEKPMGIAIAHNKLALATRNEIVVLANAPKLASTYPKQPGTYDALYLPRALLYTGELDIHDLHWDGDNLIAVNTRFSCIARPSFDHNFIPLWKPKFIKHLDPNDHCHLNGLAVSIQNNPKYASALGHSDEPNGWRKNIANGGILIDIESDEIVLQNLPMPHSPRIYDDQLYFLLSATGELVKANLKAGKYEVIKKFNGFVRGMDKIGDYLFIGLSKIRKTSSTFGNLPIAKTSPFCGIVVIHLPTASLVGQLQYENSVEEIYDVKVIADTRRPGILNHTKEDFRYALTMPKGNFWATQASKK